MSNNIAIIPAANLPAAMLEQFAALGGGADDLSTGVSSGFPVMSIRGAKWRISQGGEENAICLPGTNDLAPFVKAVLVRANQNLAKTFYAGQYVEGADTPPDCSSNDGIYPDPASPHVQAQSCATCPNNVWGSKISPSGAKIKACADVRRMAILPADDLDFDPILLRVPGASLSDLAAYGKALKQRNIPYQAVVTKLSFDPDASYPKIVFRFDRMLTAEEMQKVAAAMESPSIEDVLGLSAPRATGPVAIAAPAPAVDEFGIPATLAPAAAAAPVKTDAEMEQAVAKVEQAAAPAAKPKAAKGRGFGAAAAPEPAKETTPAPTAGATNATAKAELAPTASGDGMLDDINSALASLDFS